MQKKTVYFLILYFTASSVFAISKKSKTVKSSTECGIHQCHTNKGKIQLDPSFDDINSKSIAIRIKDDIVGNLVLYHAHIYDDHTYKDVIKGKFELNNHSNHKAHIKYQLILKDVKGLIAKTTGHIHLPRGINQAIHCSNIPLHIEDIQNISAYEIKFITSHAPLNL